MAQQVTDNTFEDEVLKAGQPVVVDFWADWCKPCQLMAPVFDGLSHEYEGRVEFLKLDVDENSETLVKYGIRSIPTFLMFKNGAEARRVAGVISKRELKRLVDALLA